MNRLVKFRKSTGHAIIRRITMTGVGKCEKSAKQGRTDSAESRAAISAND